MAIIKNVIACVDDIKPNRFSEATKVQWLNEAEGYIQTDVMMLALADIVQYDPAVHMDTELLVKPPHDKLYAVYLCAMVDFANGEYDKYSNTMQMYNEFLREYTKWYTMNFRPADGRCVREGYYLSAYAIAVLHGFDGTEEEWLESLIGAQGDPFRYEDFTPEQLKDLTGPAGRGIVSIERTEGDGSPGTTDIYTITYTDGSTTTYTVYNGTDGSGGIADETDPTVPAWAKAENPPEYTAEQVGADAAGTAAHAVAEHNVSPDAHEDIRTFIADLSAHLNAFFDSDDQTLDELSEIVEYIKSNKTLIDSITTSKVSVSDIVDNLTTNLANRPLSAAQGVVLRQMVEAIVVPDVMDVSVGMSVGSSDGRMRYFVTVKRAGGAESSITFLGGHDPVNSTAEMTQPVGADSDGKLWTKPAPVDSVNGQTGAVNLGAADVGARPDTWVPTASEVGALPANTKIPANTSDLTNDSGFITNAVADLANYYTKSQTYTQAEVNALVSAIPKFAITVVSALPTSGISGTTVYLVKSGTDADLYTEYIYVNGAWEILGSQKVDLTGYATETWVNTKLADYLPAAQLQTAINEALAQAKASGEFDGAPGTSPTVAVSAITGGHRITITDKDGTKTVDVMDGADGDPGDPGDDGRGIVSIVRTSGTGAAGTTDTYTITYTDNTTSTFEVYNGKDGDPYTLTDADKTAIAQEAAGMVDVPVKSVNAKTGAVSLDPTDLHCEPITVTGVDADGVTHTWILTGWGNNPA